MTILDDIFLKRKKDIEALSKLEPIDLFENILVDLEKDDSFSTAFKNKTEINIISEIKKASPSKGIIRENFRPICLARDLENSGAKAISVLVEPRFFYGSEVYIRAVKRFVNIPVLYKDFISTRYEIARAKVLGASIVLLIVKLLGEKNLKELLKVCEEYGIEALVETHSIDEINIALQAGAKIIGINSRNSDNFSVNIDILGNLIEALPKNIIKIAESGIKTVSDIKNLKNFGADGFLIGETFMRESFPGEKLKEFLC